MSGASEPGEAAGVRSVLRALDLLALFTEERSRWTVRELTEVSGLAKTTVLRLVATLEQRGLLWTDAGGALAAGPGLLKWARLARSVWQLPEAGQQVMRELAAGCAETVNLYVRSNTVRVCVAQQEGPQNLRHVVRVGDELPLWSGAAGRVLLVDADDALLSAVAATAPAGESTVDDLRARVAAVAGAGYAVSHGEREVGASGVAAPVLDERGHVLAALALGGPTPRFTEQKVARFAAEVVAAAQEMSRIGLGGGR